MRHISVDIAAFPTHEKRDVITICGAHEDPRLVTEPVLSTTGATK